MKSLLIYCVFLAYPATILYAQDKFLTLPDSPTILQNPFNDSLIGTIFYADTFKYVFCETNGNVYTWKDKGKYYLGLDKYGTPINIGDAIRFNNKQVKPTTL